jgi:hypothetical protein
MVGGGEDDRFGFVTVHISGGERQWWNGMDLAIAGVWGKSNSTP